MHHKRLLTIMLIGLLSISAMPVSAAETTDTVETTGVVVTVTQGGDTTVVSQQYYETLAYYLANHEWWNAITLLQAINLPTDESSNGQDMVYVTTSFGTLGLGRSGRQYAHLVEDRYGYCVASYTKSLKPLVSSGYLEGDYNNDGKVNETDTFLKEHNGEKRTYDGVVGFYSEIVS